MKTLNNSTRYDDREIETAVELELINSATNPLFNLYRISVPPCSFRGNATNDRYYHGPFPAFFAPYR